MNNSIMQGLRCMMADHESANKMIKGICTDEKCEASMRILCVTCQKKFHSTCQRELILDKEELLDKLQEKFQNTNIETPLEQLRILKARFDAQFEALEKYYSAIISDHETLKLRCQYLTRGNFNQEIRYECYDLLQQKEMKQNFDKENELLQSVQQSLNILREFIQSKTEIRTLERQQLEVSIKYSVKKGAENQNSSQSQQKIIYKRSNARIFY